jgi:hypothetical protein
MKMVHSRGNRDGNSDNGRSNGRDVGSSSSKENNRDNFVVSRRVSISDSADTNDEKPSAQRRSSIKGAAAGGSGTRPLEVCPSCYHPLVPCRNQSRLYSFYRRHFDLRT